MTMTLDVTEKAICRKVGGTFELAAQKGYFPLCFMKEWLMSDTMEQLRLMNLNEICQSKLYQLDSLLRETDIPRDESENREYCDVMYWIGYTLMWMAYQEDMPGKKIYNEYNIEEVMKNFDVLHTLSTQVTIEEIKVQFTRDYTE